MVKGVGSKEIIKALEAAGFVQVRKVGSHVRLQHPDGRRTTVQHPRKDVPNGTVASIERVTGVKVR
jgi:predicted RNA binding protein YcfA (HicA-like mRNA interferase family)